MLGFSGRAEDDMGPVIRELSGRCGVVGTSKPVQTALGADSVNLLACPGGESTAA